MRKPNPACRIHVILAKHSDIGVVFRRGPSAWWHILKWDLARLRIDRGAWLRASLYPTRSAISPNGEILGYCAKHDGWDTYFALAKVPWLSALCSWKTAGTWTTGADFGLDGKLRIFGAICSEQPFHGECPFPYEFGGVDTNWNRARDFQLLVNGWVPKNPEVSVAAFSPGPHDVTELNKYSPIDHSIVLTRYSEFASCIYSITYGHDQEHLLAEVSWADFDRAGRLIVASASGELNVYEVRDSNLVKVFSEDLNPLKPDPVEAPAWATNW